MALTVIERIAQEILDRLDVLAVEDEFTIVRPDREGSNLSPTDKKIVLRQQPSVWNPQLSCAGNPAAMAFDVVFMVVCSVRNVYGNDEQYDAACNRCGNQIIEAITTPETSPSTWYSMGGIALNSNIGSVSPYISLEGFRAGVVVSIVVNFRVSENDHTVARI